MPWATYVFRSIEKGRAVPSRVYKVSYYAAENDSAMKELEAIFKLQQAGVAGVPKNTTPPGNVPKSVALGSAGGH